MLISEKELEERDKREFLDGGGKRIPSLLNVPQVIGRADIRELRITS